MSGSLLDTSFIIHILQGDSAAVKTFRSMDEAYVSAIAKQNNLSVATYDVHFEHVEGVDVINPGIV